MTGLQSICLDKLPAIFLDIQTSAAHPDKGSIIEIGWASSADKKIRSYLIRPKDGDLLSDRVQSITGISQKNLASAGKIRKLYKKFTTAAQKIAALSGSDKCPVVAHYARFEKRFINELDRSIHTRRKSPYDFICTHEICRRLMPDLPRRSIRAIAGYLGSDISEHRRCAEHVKATIIIWQKLVATLKEKHRISTLSELKKWLVEDRPRKTRTPIFPIKIKYHYFPDQPGIYCMQRSDGSILYIGKATSLRSRVKSYFRKKAKHPEHILEMLSQAKKITYAETKSALEAALVESDAIKKNKPPYNIALRDSERRIWFCDRAFQKFANKLSKSINIGPIDSPEIFKALATLAKGIWIQRQEQADQTRNEDDANEIEEDNWTTETVSHLLESYISRAFHALRKARWLTWLTESTIIWEEKINKRPKRLFMVLQKGEIKEHRELTGKKKIPLPPGWRKKFARRQKNFDLMTFDRMRIVLTELRRMLNAGQFVNVIIQDKVLDEETLKKIYKWI